jgi:hypothetical protein
MTDREIVEWVARARVGDALPPMLSWSDVARALHREIGFRMPYEGEEYGAWCRDASAAAQDAGAGS